MDDQQNLVEKDEGELPPEDPQGLEQFVSQDSLYRLGQKAILEAELFHRSLQLKNFASLRERLRTEPSKADDIYKELSARSDDIRQQLRRFRAPQEPTETVLPVHQTDRFHDLTRPYLNSRGEIVFATTGTVPFPKAKNAASVRPRVPGTSGFIKVMLRETNGTVHFDGTIKAEPPSSPTTLHTWLRSWKYVIPFPPPISKSILTYTFSVFVEARLFAEVSDGTVMSFVSVGENSNFKPGDTIEIDQDAGWPLVGDLTEPTSTYNGHYGRLLGTLPVQRAFGVGGGKTPAVAIAGGVAGSIASGECAFQFGAYSRIVPSSDAIDGLLSYRYDPVEIADP